MGFRHLIAVLAICSCTAQGVQQPPEGWEWTTQHPFRRMTVAASSEQADRWPAAKAIDGDTSEPEGLWQTSRNGPKSAWLELRLGEPRRVAGVRVFHQLNPRYYRSVDYTVACLIDGTWKTVADVKGNKKSGWVVHQFPEVTTASVRVTITKSEYGYRMGLNEVALLLPPEDGRERIVETSPPYRCGKVRDLGVISFDAFLAEGTKITLATRTAPDADGKPGDWSPWSREYERSGEKVDSPVAEWIQYRATLHCSAKERPVLQAVRIGSPECVETVDIGALLPRPGEPLSLRVRFSEMMSKDSRLTGRIVLPGSEPQCLARGKWEEDGKVWQFEPVKPAAAEGVGRLVIGGAEDSSGLRMMHEDVQIVVGPRPILDRLKGIAEWMMENPHKAIFVEGYNERTILALYEITGDRRYLDHVRAWVGELLDRQKTEGYWGTGYGNVYFADTGSALGLLVNFYKFGTPDEKRRIQTALERYANLLLVRGDSTGKPFVHEDGSVGVGYVTDKQGNVTKDLNKPYTIATALTGAEIFAAMYYMFGNERHKEVAVKACDWLLDTTGPDGQIPYYIDDWNPGRKDQAFVWERWPYDTSAYAGEGFVAAWTYIDDAAFRAELGRRVKPHIEWLLKTQNEDGSWAKRSSGDQLRSHGVVNLLLWYYEDVDRDPRVAEAVRRYYLLLLDEEKSEYLRVPGDGIATSLAGRALVEIVRPGVDCYRWKDERR